MNDRLPEVGDTVEAWAPPLEEPAWRHGCWE